MLRLRSLARLPGLAAVQSSIAVPSSSLRAFSAGSSRRKRTSDTDFGGWYDTRCRSTTILSVRKDDKVVRTRAPQLHPLLARGSHRYYCVRSS